MDVCDTLVVVMTFASCSLRLVLLDVGIVVEL